MIEREPDWKQLVIKMEGSEEKMANKKWISFSGKGQTPDKSSTLQ